MTAVEQALADQVRVRTYLEEQAAEVEGLIVRMAPAMQESYREKSRPHLALAAFESELARLRAEVKRLTEAQNRLEQGWADATADVERLTREREGYLRDFLTARERAEAAEAEVERLTRERDEARDALDARETWQERFRAAEAVAASYRQALESLVAEVELNAARKATAAGLGASEWEAFIAESVYQALKVARAALASSAETGTPETVEIAQSTTYSGEVTTMDDANSEAHVCTPQQTGPDRATCPKCFRVYIADEEATSDERGYAASDGEQ